MFGSETGPTFVTREITSSERQDFEDHPERYPYYVRGLLTYPDKVPYKFVILNLPGIWDDALLEHNHKAAVIVRPGEDPVEVRKLAESICKTLNLLEGRSYGDYKS